MSSATSNVSTESSMTTGIIILVVLVSLVVLAIAMFFFTRNKNNATPLPEFKGPNVQPPSNAPSFNVGRPRNVP
jgi:flagellar basal body-associated protein FliL